MNRDTGQLLLTMDNAEATSIATGDANAHSQTRRTEMCYEMAWEPDIDLLNRQEIRRLCEAERPDRPSSGIYYEKIDLLLVMFMKKASEALDQNDIAPDSHLQQYAAWLNRQIKLFNAGRLPHRSAS